MRERSDHFAQRSREEYLRQRCQFHASLSIQFHRRLRRMLSAGSERYAALREISHAHDFGPDFVATLISVRKRKVRAYLRRRRDQIVVRLMDEGLTQKEIAKQFNVSSTTIGNRYKAYQKMHRERPDLYPMHSKQHVSHRKVSDGCKRNRL